MPAPTHIKTVSELLAEGYAALAAGGQWTAEHEAAKRLADGSRDMLDCLNDNLSAWGDEEDSVQEEHRDLIDATRRLVDKVEAGK